jgi:hypothetical protein
LMAKNAAVAGTFSTSSWFGMNFARITALQLPPEKRPYMPMPFSEKIAREGHTGVEALDEVRKPSGAINYNNLMYARVSRRMIRDDLRSIAIEPGAYLRGVAAAWLLFFYPADVWPFTAANRLRMARWCGFWDNVLCARVDLPTPVRGVEALFATLLLGIPVSLAIAARDRRTWVALALVLSVAVLGNFAEMGENYRFRFLVGPLSAAVAAAGLSRKRSLRVPDSAAPAATA